AQFSWQKTGAGWRADGGRLTQAGSGEWKSSAPTIRALDAKLSFLPKTSRIVELGNLDTAMLRTEQPGGSLEMPFEVKQAWRGKVWARLLDYHDRGTLKFFLDGKPVGAPHDSYYP